MKQEARGGVLVEVHEPVPVDFDTLFRALNEVTGTSRQLYDEVNSFKNICCSYDQDVFELSNWMIWQKAIHLARMAEHLTKLLALDMTTLRSPYMPQKAKDGD